MFMTFSLLLWASVIIIAVIVEAGTFQFISIWFALGGIVALISDIAGATFGNVVGPLLGLSPSFGAGIGLISVFCGVTNCPLASMILSVEIFGSEGLMYFAISCAIGYLLSGYTGLYSEQKILYSKTKAEYINRKTH